MADETKFTADDIITIAQFVLGAVFLYVIFFTDFSLSSCASERSSDKPAKTVTLKELEDGYSQNEAKAQLDYGDRPLIVTATVKYVTLDSSDDPVVHLESDGIFTIEAMGMSQEDAATLSKGEVATIECFDITEILGEPRLLKCGLPGVEQ